MRYHFCLKTKAYKHAREMKSTDNNYWHEYDFARRILSSLRIRGLGTMLIPKQPNIHTMLYVTSSPFWHTNRASYNASLFHVQDIMAESFSLNVAAIASRTSNSSTTAPNLEGYCQQERSKRFTVVSLTHSSEPSLPGPS
jgi:hypothetical protein